jgi:Flp pilus assembly protein protease CpaA
MLTAVYWGTPAAWLLVPFAVIGAVAADCDLRSLRIPNRMLAAGAVAELALVLVVGSWFGAPMVAPAVAGAAIAGAPLFAQHVVTGGRTPGLGDAKLAAVLGLVAGAIYPAVAVTGLLVSLLLGAVFGLLWQRRWRRGPRFPLGPALVAGMAVAVAIWRLLGGATTW